MGAGRAMNSLISLRATACLYLSLFGSMPNPRYASLVCLLNGFMHRALRPGGDVADLQALYAAGCPIDMVDEDGRTALYVAASTGYDEAVVWLLNMGADPFITAADQRTPLHAAAAAGRVAAATSILDSMDNRYDVMRVMQAADGSGQTPAQIAAAGRHLDVVRALLTAHAESTRRSPESKTVTGAGHMNLNSPVRPEAVPTRGYLVSMKDSPVVVQPGATEWQKRNAEI